MLRSRLGRAAAIVAITAGLAGCGLQVPTDPDGSLDRIAGDVLHAGASAEAGLVEVDDGEVSGPLPDLVTTFAERWDARVEWTVGSEETLVTALEDGTIDIAVGGFTRESPWTDRAGMTRGFPGVAGADGREIVLLVPLGENRLLSELEMFLDDEVTR